MENDVSQSELSGKSSSAPGFTPPVKSNQLPAGKKLTKDLVLSKSKGGSLIELKKIVIWGQKISDCSIVTEIPELEVASMTANQISTLEHFGQCPNLRELFLRSNCIKDIHQIYYLKDLPNLQVLWLAGNPCTQHPRYRSTVIRNLEQLQKLDDAEISQTERAASETEGLLFNEPPQHSPVAAVENFSSSNLAELMEPAKDVPAVLEASSAEAAVEQPSQTSDSASSETASKVKEVNPSQVYMPTGIIDSGVSEEKISDSAAATASSTANSIAPRICPQQPPPSVTPLPSYALTEVRTAVLRLIRLLDQESLQLVLLTVRSRLESQQQVGSSTATEIPQQTAGGTNNSVGGADISSSFSLDNL